MNRPRLAVSAMTIDLTRIAEELALLEAAGFDEVYVPVMDGHFAPGLFGGPDLVRAVKQSCGLACHVHLMIDSPEKYIADFIAAGSNAISVHPEAAVHTHRTLGQIHSAGVEPGIALKPGTPLILSDYLLDEADRVMLLATDPCADGRTIPNAYERVNILVSSLSARNLRAEVTAGVVSHRDDAAQLTRAGAHGLVISRGLARGVGIEDDPNAASLREMIEYLARQI